MKTQTHRVYRFHITVPLSRYAIRDRTRAELRVMLSRVWERRGRGPTPALSFRPGPTSMAHLYADGSFEIVLIPIHQCYHTLLHEIAHCLNPDEKIEHGPRFMATYIRLMHEFARMPEEELLINAALYGIKVHGFAHS